MSEYGIEVSKQGVPVQDARFKDMIFTSRLNQLKIIKTLEGDFTKTGGGQEEFNLAHNLGYTPGFLPFLKVSSRWYGVHGEDPTSGLGWQIYADKTNITAKVTGGGGTSLKIKVFVLVDSGKSNELSTKTEGHLGMEVSQVGEEAGKSVDKNLAFSSEFETLQIVKVISSRNDRSGGSAERTVAHGLDYTPAWVAFGLDNIAPPHYVMPYLLVGNRELMVWSDGDNVGNRIESIAPSEDITFKTAVLSNRLE